MGLDRIGLEADGGAVLGDGLVQLPLVEQSDAEIAVGLGIIGVEADGGAVLGDCFGPASPGPVSALPRLLWATA